MDRLNGEEALALLKAEASLDERTVESVKKYLDISRNENSIISRDQFIKGFVTLKDLFLLTLEV
jgi:hypothetical protein